MVRKKQIIDHKSRFAIKVNIPSCSQAPDKPKLVGYAMKLDLDSLAYKSVMWQLLLSSK